MSYQDPMYYQQMIAYENALAEQRRQEYLAQQQYIRQQEQLQQAQQQELLERQMQAASMAANSNMGASYGNANFNMHGFAAAEAQRNAMRQELRANQTGFAGNRAYNDMWRDREMQIPENDIRRRHNNQAYQIGSNESLGRGQIDAMNRSTAAKERMNAVNAEASKAIADGMSRGLGSSLGGNFGGGTPNINLWDNSGRRIGGSFGTIRNSLLG